SSDLIADILSANRVVNRYLTDGAEHLDLFIPQRPGGKRGGRLHRNKRQKLKQVILKHIAHDTCRVVVTGAMTDIDRLGNGDLNVVNRSEEHTSELQSRENLVC